MAGGIFVSGEIKVRPGIYHQISNIGENPPIAGEFGTVAVIIRADWGPLGTPQTLESLFAVDDAYGVGLGTDDVREIFRGGASQVVVQRVGSGGTLATKTLVDTTGTPVDSVRIDAKYPGPRANNFFLVLRESLTNPTTERELVVYEGTTLLQTIPFASGSSGGGEAQKLVTAVTNSNSQWITATLIAASATMALVSTPVTMGNSGANPTADSAAYGAAMTAIETENFDWVVVDTDTWADGILASLVTFVGRLRSEGKFAKTVVGEPTSVTLSDRQTHAASFNKPYVLYTLNGFVTANGNIQGHLAAARVAGMISRTPVTSSLTHAVVTGATSLLGALTNTQIIASLRSGALVFTKSELGQVVIEQGITTYTVLNANEDAGWKKVRRLRTRDSMMSRILLAWEPSIGVVNNNENGRISLTNIANGVLLSMQEEGALSYGRCYVDPDNPPAGDAAYFVVEADDVDSLEHIYVRFGLRFAPPVETA